MARNNELIKVAKKAADAWRNTDAYYQAAQIIDMLVEELESNALTQPNEPLTCEGCIYEHNEHENCNYCKRAPYLGDYYYRRPPEGEEEEKDVIKITENL